LDGLYHIILKTIQHIIAFCLVFLVLFSSAGISIYTHVCLSAGMQEASLFPIQKCVDRVKTINKSCCAAEKVCKKPTIEADDNCCDYDSKYVDNDGSQFVQDFIGDFDFALVPVLELLPNAKISYPFFLKLLPKYLDLPPPKSGKFLIILYETFLC